MVVFLTAVGAGTAQAQSVATLRGAAGLGNAAAVATPRPVRPPPATGMNSATARALVNQSRSQAALDLATQAQKAAREAAYARAGLTVPNGLGLGGLDPVDNPLLAVDDPTGLNTWQGATAPVQTTTANGVQVTIDQTQSQAILSWETFNIGRDTTLVFNQKSGGEAQTGWVALNRVVGQIDPSTGLRDPARGLSPSQILGAIKSDGTVLVLNQNGVIFGATSQVNAFSLIATSLEIGRAIDLSGGPLTIRDRNNEFLNFGLLGYADQAAADLKPSAFTFSAQAVDLANYDPTLEGEIRVEAGAEINAGDGGFVLLTGPRVINSGHLTATDGQVTLQAGRQVTLSRSEGRDDSLDPDVRGFIARAENRRDAAGSYVLNTAEGLIESERGYLSLGATVDGAVVQQGMLRATTSVARNGFISITAGDIQLAADSTLTIDPDDSKETIPQDPVSVAAFKASRVDIGDANSRIEIGANSLIYAPSGEISIGAKAGATTVPGSQAPGTSRIFVDSGAVIDAAGLKNVLIPATRNSILIRPVKRNELRDTPDYREGFLNGAFVYVDPRLSGVRADGVAWVGSPLIEAESYYQQVGATVSERMTRGGNVTLGVASYSPGGALLTAPDVIIKSGASIDISGGWVKYEAGFVQTSRLVNAQGQVVDIAYADPNETYIGVYNGYTLSQPRWGVFDTFANPLLNGVVYAGEYTEGRDAGSLTIKSSILALDGTIFADSFAGALQTFQGVRGTGTSGVYGDHRAIQGANSELPSGGLLFLQGLARDSNGNLTGAADIAILDESGVEALPGDLAYGQSVSFDDSGALVITPRDPLSMLSDTRLGTIQLSAQALSTMGLGQLTLATSGSITLSADAEVNLGAGAIFDGLAGRAITIDGTIRAASGQINLETTNVGFGSVINPTAAALGSFDITINGTLSTRGQWVNDFGYVGDDLQTRAFIDGGSISLTSAPRVSLEAEVASVADTLSGDAPRVNTDISGSILLTEGSVIDVSGGGYVDTNGVVDLSAKGGDLSLINDTTYFQLTEAADRSAGSVPGFRVSTILNTGGAAVVAVNPDRINARISLEGAILAHGFDGGGTFTLRTPRFGFGDTTAETGTNLSLNFFSEAGFANYDIVSYDTAFIENTFTNRLGGYHALFAVQTVSIGAGETLNLSQSMFSPLLSTQQIASLNQLSTGGDLYSVLSPTIAADAWDRRAINLSLGGSIELHVEAGGALINEAGGTLTVSRLLNDGLIRMPGGSIRQVSIMPTLFSGSNVLGVSDLSEVFSTRSGGRIFETDLNAAGIGTLTNAQLAAQIPVYLTGELGAEEGVRLSDGSVTDLSGVTILNPRASPAMPGSAIPVRDGVVINGGSLMSASSAQLTTTLFRSQLSAGVYVGQNPLTARVGLAVTAESGAVLDLSGVSDTFVRVDTLRTTPVGDSPGLIETAVWSNGGTLYLGSGGTLGGADIRAHGGSDEALGGNLVVLDPTLYQTDPTDPVFGAISAEMIENAGFSTLQAMGSITSVGDVDLHLDRAFFLTSRPYGALNGQDLNDPTTRDSFAAVVRSGGELAIHAPYVRLESGVQTVSTPFVGTPGDFSASFHADIIDVSGAVLFDQSVGRVLFDATGDVRLSGVQPYQLNYGVGDQTVANSLVGQLAVSGDLTIRAAQLYPTTGSAFSVTSAADDGLITIERASAETPRTPYSAGGNLLIQAANIVQGGVVRTPLGSLTLGSNTPRTTLTGGLPTVFAPATQSVILTDGSVTSVSADGLTIPYGVTTDGIEWFFSPTGASALTAPPAAILSFGGVDVSLESGAIVDVRGGGDLVAYEFVSGTGGSRDVLSRFNNDPFSGNGGYQYPDERQVYAIVPGLSDASVAPVDPIYSADYGDLYAASGAGRRVYLAAVPGLAAGWYTLLPAQYAVLPGAFRVVEQTGAAAATPNYSGRVGDGSYYVSGYYGFQGSRESDIQTFQVSSQDVFRKYSNIQLSLANTIFAAQAVKAGTAAPRLPIDAGRLVLNPTETLTIDATLLTAAAPKGRGAQADVSGRAFEIVSVAGSGTGTPGVIELTAGSLNNLNAASLLIGGVRTNNADGSTTLDLTAQSIVVSNDAANPLTGPEVVLAVDGSGAAITVADGAAIVASGELDDDRDGVYVINGASGTMTGEGAILRVASGPERLVRRVNVDAGLTTGVLDVGTATVSGQSVLLNASGDLLISGLADIDADSLALGAGKVTFTDDGAGLSGLVVTSTLRTLFGRADRLTIQTPNVIDFDAGDYLFGDLTLDAPGLGLVGGTGAVNLTVGDLELANTSAASAACDDLGALTCGTGILSVNAASINFGSGAIRTYGFGGGVTLAASGGMFVEGKGSFDVGPADLTLKTPFLGDRAVTLSPGEAALLPSLSLVTTGAVVIDGTGYGALSSIAGTPGASLSVSGASVLVRQTRVRATAGSLKISSDGDIEVADGATLETPGYSRTFGDVADPYVVSAPGGLLQLTSANGAINLRAESLLSVGGGKGRAGTLVLSAVNGDVIFDGTLNADSPDGGGSFSLATGGAFDLANLETGFASDFNGRITVATGTGDLVLAASQTLVAEEVNLIANGGLVDIAGRIDTSGVNGGDVGLYGSGGVTLRATAVIDAHAEGYEDDDSRQAKAGDVELGVSGTGAITVAAGARIDVSASRTGDRLIPSTRNGETYYSYVQGDLGGSVRLRAPLIEQPGADTTNVSYAGQIIGAREIVLEAYKAFDLGTIAADPNFVGVTINADGQAVLDVAAQQAGRLNWLGDNGAGTLVSFVQDFDVSGAYGNLGDLTTSDAFHARPGMELTYAGDVVLNSNWNLGAGSVDVAGAVAAGLMAELPSVPGKFYVLPGKEAEVFARFTSMTYRTGGSVDGESGILTIRAEGDLDINGSITDGFFNFRDQTDPDYLNLALGGGNRVYNPYLGPGCAAGNCTNIGSWQSTGGIVPPTGYIIVNFPGATGLGGLLVNPAPYSEAANSAAALGTLPGGTGDPIGSAELFPLLQNVDGGWTPVSSWTYRLVGGSNLGGADPMAVDPTSLANVTIQGHRSYSFVGVRGTSVLSDDLLFRVGSQFVDATDFYQAFVLANPNLAESSYTFINFAQAPLAARAILQAKANYYFAANGGSSFDFVGPPGAPTGVTTTLSLASAFLSEVSADFAALQPFYRAPNVTTVTRPTTVSTSTLVRTGSGDILIAASANIDLRNGAEPVLRNLDGSFTTALTGIQAGGVAVYTAGHRVDLSPRQVLDTLTGQTRTFDPTGYAISQDQFASALVDGYRYGAGGAPDAAGAGFLGVMIANPVYAEGGGDISLDAGEDVLGRRDLWLAGLMQRYQNNSLISAYSWMGRYDQPWRTGLVGPVTNIRINPQLFTEGVGTLSGGDIDIRAGRDVSDLTVAADTSVTTASVGSEALALASFGRGDVSIAAGRDLAGIRLDIGSGEADLAATGRVGSAGDLRFYNGFTFSVGANATRVRLTDATVAVSAGDTIALQGVAALGASQAATNVQNDLMALGFYSGYSGLSLTANGQVTVANSGADVLTAAGRSNGFTHTAVYPGSLEAVSLTGDLTLTTAVQTNNVAAGILLYPSSVGVLTLVAGADIGSTIIAMDDGDEGLLPGAFSSFTANSVDGVLTGRPFLFPGVLPETSEVYRATLHDSDITHLGDEVPNRIYAGGDINRLTLSVPKQTRITAGRDIINMAFFGQNVGANDITRITAGRDITATTRLLQPFVGLPNQFGAPLAALEGNTFVIGGGGSFFLEAGRDLGPFLNSATVTGFDNGVPSPTPAVSRTYGGGVLSVGNEWNPWLDDEGADLFVQFGVGKGANYTGFRDGYLDPANLANLDGDLFEQVKNELGVLTPDRDKPIYGPILVAWMKANAANALIAAHGSTSVDYEQAYEVFKSLPELQQRVFILKNVFFNELTQTSIPTGPSFLQYSRGYRAVNTLFPAAYGYTANDLEGGNGASTLVQTGDLDLRLATIQTSRGGDIYILGPGGRVLAGSTVRTSDQAARRAYDGGRLYAGGVRVSPLAATISSIPSGYEGVLTLRGGSISSFTDQDFLLNQSRLFTQAGGDIAMWSSNGDLNAGQGPKTSANFPPVVVKIDANLSSELDTAGAVTGAGISAFQPDPDADPPSVFLIAPRGTVDAGDAGVRVTGSLFVAAQTVANADNFSVGGSSFGIPTGVTVDVGAQTGASAASAAAQDAAQAATNAGGRGDAQSVITVNVLGAANPQEDDCPDKDGDGEDNCPAQR
jgi:filamentous hemagglutinin family protein